MGDRRWVHEGASLEDRTSGTFRGTMQDYQEAMLKSLVAVAWADGRMDGEESEVIDALIAAFGIDEEAGATLKEYAKEKRTLEDVPLTDLSASDRRQLLQHAVILSYVDGEQSDTEKQVLSDLTTRLKVPEDEAGEIMKAAGERAQRLLSLL